MDEDAEDTELQSHFNRLPDEILLQIFNKLLDLSCLYRCSVVSKRFQSLIPLIHSASFTVPRLRTTLNSPTTIANHSPLTTTNTADSLPKRICDAVSKPFRFIRQIFGPKPLPSSISSFYGDSFRSAVCFLSKFKEIRSLHIQIPSSSHAGGGGDMSFKWRVTFGPKLESFVFLSYTKIQDLNGFPGGGGGGGGDAAADDEGLEESELIGDLLKSRVHSAFQRLKDAIVRHRMLLFLIEQHPMLQNLVISDSRKEGRLAVRGEQLTQLRNWISSASTTLGPQLKTIEVPVAATQWYVPLLELPDSGFVMEGAVLVVMNMVVKDTSDGHDFGVGQQMVDAFGEGEEAFGEAVTEMIVNHRRKMKTLL